MTTTRVNEITGVRLVTGSEQDAKQGLLGWISCTLNGALRLDGITLRRTRDGRRVLSFPVRHDRDGRQHPIVRPLGDEARREIERQVFRALDLEEGTGP